MKAGLVRRLRSVREQVHHVYCYNVHTLLSSPLPEASGALGDLPTFLPLFLALSHARLISPGSTLFVAGLTNLYTGLIFGVPLPVQPMKAIAAAALLPSSTLTANEVASAGLFVAACIALLTLTGTVAWFTRAVPRSVVKGVQLGAGLGLALSAAQATTIALKAQPRTEAPLFVAALVLLVPATLRPRKVPFVLVLITLTIVVPLAAWLGHCIVGRACGAPSWAFAVWQPRFHAPSPKEFGRGALGAGLSQLPLTTLNSIVAVVHLAQDLYPDAPREYAPPDERSNARVAADDGADPESLPPAPSTADAVSQPAKAPTASAPSPPILPSASGIGLSLLLPNLLGPFIHALPVCHGSGGLAAQHRFGARSGASVMLLGLLKLALGLGAGPAVAWWADTCVPASWRGLLVFLAGIGLAVVGADVDGREGSAGNMEARVVVLVTTGVTLGVRNAGVGFVVGMATVLGQWLMRWESNRQGRREGRIRLEETQTI